MSHYYSEKQDVESEERLLTWEHKGRSYTFVSDRGVFSKNRVDFATAFLLESLEVPKTASNALDLGTGYGVIGIVLNRAYELNVTMSDVNERALALAEKNLSLNDATGHIVKSDAFSALEGQCFDLIVSNPPIRVGKDKLFSMLSECADHLRKNGQLWVVAHKKHGAKTLKKHLDETFNTTISDKKKGFFVFVCEKR